MALWFKIYIYIYIFRLRFTFSNSVSELCVPLCLPEIKTLDLSKNNVESVSAHFLAECPKLETLNFSMNKICKYFSPSAYCSIWKQLLFVLNVQKANQKNILAQFAGWFNLSVENWILPETHQCFDLQAGFVLQTCMHFLVRGTLRICSSVTSNSSMQNFHINGENLDQAPGWKDDDELHCILQ